MVVDVVIHMIHTPLQLAAVMRQFIICQPTVRSHTKWGLSGIVVLFCPGSLVCVWESGVRCSTFPDMPFPYEVSRLAD